MSLHFKTKIDHELASYPIENSNARCTKGTCIFTEHFEFDSADAMLNEFKSLCIRVNADSFFVVGLESVTLEFNPVNDVCFEQTYQRCDIESIGA